MAMCVIAVVGDAPCQCFSPGSKETTSPGRNEVRILPSSSVMRPWYARYALRSERRGHEVVEARRGGGISMSPD